MTSIKLQAYIFTQLPFFLSTSLILKISYRFRRNSIFN